MPSKFTSLLSIMTVAPAASQTVRSARTKRVTCATGEVTANAACCGGPFPHRHKLKTKLFDGAECGEEAHFALRLPFHDAIGFSIHGGKGGGADGSMFAFNLTETAYHANGSTDDIIIASQFPVFQETTLSAGDFVHLAAAVGRANFPGGLNFFFGRPAPRAPAPDLAVPEDTDTVTAILARFSDAGFSPQEVVALLSSHTIAAADVVDLTIPGTPFDSTTGTFDSQIFLEVLLKGTLFPGNGSQPGEALSPLAGEMRLQSDFAISQDSRTACLWQNMINNQQLMTTNFKSAMTKLQLLGHNKNSLIDCSDVVPVPSAFAGPFKFPASFPQKDIQTACPQQPFPSIPTVAGPAPTIPRVRVF